MRGYDPRVCGHSRWFEGRFRVSAGLLVTFCGAGAQVGYPLVTVLLCVGDPALFTQQLPPYLEALFKVLKVTPGPTDGNATAASSICFRIAGSEPLLCHHCVFIFRLKILPSALPFPKSNDSVVHSSCLLSSARCFVVQEKAYRSMALECLQRLVRFYLEVHAGREARAVTAGILAGVTGALLASLRKGNLPLEAQHDKLVHFAATLADSHLDFAMNSMLLELLRPDNPPEAKVRTARMGVK